jgi:hypothetical protein
MGIHNPYHHSSHKRVVHKKGSFEPGIRFAFPVASSLTKLGRNAHINANQALQLSCTNIYFFRKVIFMTPYLPENSQVNL